MDAVRFRRKSTDVRWLASIACCVMLSVVACSQDGGAMPTDAASSGDESQATPPLDQQAQLFRRRRERIQRERSPVVPNIAPVETTTKSFTGPLPKLTKDQQSLAAELRRDVTVLATEIGERNVIKFAAYMKAARYLEQQLTTAGYKVASQKVETRGRDCLNLEVELRGTKQPDEIVVVGAHYDSVADCPAANDNGSGVAATLALARHFARQKPEKTMRFVLFANEEMPYFHTDSMGSLAYARRCKERKEKIIAMFSLETMGYYSDAEGSQNYPPPLNLLYPSTGNFVGFVGNLESTKLVKETTDSFRKHAKFPSQLAALPAAIDGVGWSDHWSFWQVGYPALMVTDTAPFRYPHYHKATDTPDKLNFERMARVVEGLEKVLEEMVGVERRSDCSSATQKDNSLAAAARGTAVTVNRFFYQYLDHAGLASCGKLLSIVGYCEVIPFW